MVPLLFEKLSATAKLFESEEIVLQVIVVPI
jgi:hypothetical protein